MARRKLEVEIVGDERGLNRALGRAETRLATFGKRADKGFKGFGMVSGKGAAGGFAGGLVTAAALGEARKMVLVASNLNEQAARARQIFAGSASEIEAWSKTTASSLGVAQDQALAFAGTFGLLFRNVGQSTSQASAFSRELVQLAADMASFNNTSVEDALLAIRSGLTGEIEPLRRYGVFLSEARTRAQALADTHKRSAADLTTGEKVLARYKLLLEDTTLTQGDFARTSGGLANQQRILAAEVRDLEADIGTLLLPAVTELVSGLNDGIGAAREFGAALSAIGDIDIPPIEVPIVGVKIPGTGSSIGDVAKEAFLQINPATGPLRRTKQLYDFAFGGGAPPKDVAGAAAAWQKQFGFTPPTTASSTTGSSRPPAFGQPGFKPLPPPPLVTGIPPRLESLLLDARRTKGAGDDLNVLGQQRKVLENALRDVRLSPEQIVALKRELDGVIGQVEGIYADMAASARDAKDAAAESRRKQREATEKALRAQEEFQDSLVERAEDIRDAALAALDRKQSDRDTARALADARDALAQVVPLGDPLATRDARRELEDAQLDRRRFLLQQAEITPGRARGADNTPIPRAERGFDIHIGNLTLPNVTNAEQLLKALQRLQSSTAASRRGRYGGSRSGI